MKHWLAFVVRLPESAREPVSIYTTVGQLELQAPTLEEAFDQAATHYGDVHENARIVVVPL